MNRIWLAVLPIDGSIITFEWKSRLCVLAEIVSFRALSTRTPTFILVWSFPFNGATMKRMIRKCGRCREMGEKSGAADGKQLKGQQLSLLSGKKVANALNGIIFNYETARFTPARDESVTRCQPRYCSLAQDERRAIFAGTMAASRGSKSSDFQVASTIDIFPSSGNCRAARRNGTKKSSCLLRRVFGEDTQLSSFHSTSCLFSFRLLLMMMIPPALVKLPTAIQSEAN